MDRNEFYSAKLHYKRMSLSARRAWIEMLRVCCEKSHKKVALRKESVDRNLLCFLTTVRILTSLSARRAWIEIGVGSSSIPLAIVALRKESVDRNNAVPNAVHHASMSLSARRAWIEIMLKESLQPIRKGRSPQGERG